MDLIPIQTTDLIVGQPLPWDLFDQGRQPIQKRGYIFKTEDELKQLEELPVFRMEKQDPEQAEPATLSPEKTGFEDMHLKVGHKMHLTLATYSKNASENNSCAVSMIGYVPDSTLIVSMPASDQLIGEPFIEGDQIHVRLITGQYAYKFTVFVDKIIRVPFKYLHLSFPKEIQGQSIRKSRRIKCNFPATVAEKSIPISITDLSICGAGITSSLPLGTLGSEVTLSFAIALHDREIPLSIKATIRSAKQSAKKNQKIICTGVEYTGIKPDQVFALRHLIYQEIVEHPENVI
ncbi:MAG: flagellar brake protein [Nitrosomonas oligotropha]|uniref:Flagellar brake protein n=1 Tax=Nitrosomonas oligotropha TaxID=42354 RepID=A0A5C7VQT0_9PROT|nr:MAG: flagellar brake protein [Nitrosomonas oligotropha]